MIIVMMGCHLNNMLINGLVYLLLIISLIINNNNKNIVLATTIPSSAKFYTIHWNSTNPIFRIDNTDNIIDVNRNNLKFEFDQVNLICPVYAPDTKNDSEMEKYIIYNVSKDEYETCRITNPNPRIIAVCDKPYKLMYFTITFRPFTPQPGGLEFLPGHDYYFISTSTNDDLHRRIGGKCTTHNMKIVFKVWSGNNIQQSTLSTSLSTLPTSTVTSPKWWSITSPPHYNIQQHIPTSTLSISTLSTQSTSSINNNNNNKKLKTYNNKHPNEVVKSEELTLGGNNINKSSNCFIMNYFKLQVLFGVCAFILLALR